VSAAVVAASGSVLSKAPGAARALAAGVLTLDAGAVASSPTRLVTLTAGVSYVGGSHLVDVFEGGSAGVGHHPDNYVEHVRSAADPRVTAFLSSVAAAGYTSPGIASAVDVSAAGRGRRARSERDQVS
jgi:hypothetical protein